MKILWMSLVILVAMGCNQGKGSDEKIPGGKNEKIIKLLEVTGALDLGKQMSAAMSGQIISIWKAGGNTIDAQVSEMFQKRFAEAVDKEMEIGSSLVTDLIAIYSKHYSEKNVDDLLRFYTTETGAKVVKTMPNIFAESMAAGQKWGQEKGALIADEVIEEIRKEGHKIPEI